MSQPSRYTTLLRVLSLLRLLDGHARWTLGDLAQRFAVSTRTIRRDFDLLQRVGYPIAHEERSDGGNGYWWMIGGKR